MRVTFDLRPGGMVARATVVLGVGQTLAEVWARHQGEPWLEEATELVVVGDVPVEDPLQGAPPLRERVARGALTLVRRTYEEQDTLEAEAIRLQHVLTEEEAAALAVARREGPRERPPHPDAAKLPQVPINARELLPPTAGWRRWFGGERVPRESPLAKHVGPRIPADVLASGEEELAPELAERVRAWPLPGLEGRVLVARGIGGIPGALRALLAETFGDLPFGTEEGPSYGGLGLYLHLHTCVTAPPSGGEPMALELYGRVIAVGEHDLGAPSGARLLLQRSREREDLDAAPQTDAVARARGNRLLLGADLPTPLFVLIETATYANVRFPGVGVPFYM
jgi:hypothetical protein